METAQQVVRALGRAYREHALMTHASAIAFRVLVSLVPLTLLGLGLLGALGLGDVWEDSIGPAVRDRVTAPVYTGIDFSVDEILSSSSPGLLAFAAVLLVWDLAWGVRAIMAALNDVHAVGDDRPWHRRLLVTVGLALSTGSCLVAAFLMVTMLPRLGEGGVRVALIAAAWVVAALLLGLAVALLVRYAPAEHPEVRWASLGSALVVAGWLLASAFFGWWAGSVADYRSAAGSLTVFLALTAYVLVCSGIFLVGVELDEQARSRRGGTSG